MRICFFGDSFVNGTGDPECLGWAGRICAAACQQGHDITYYNLGVRRQTSSELEQRWLQELRDRLSPEFDSKVVFSFGVNDTTIENGKTRVELATSLENARQILTTAQQMYPTLMVGLPPVADREQNTKIAQLSSLFAQICQEVNVPYLDVFTPLQASNVWITEASENDGAHPHAAGYTELATIVQNWVAWFK